MRLRVLSDLHVERAPFVPAAGEFDLVVLAGDIDNGARAVHWARAAFPHHPIVQIAGNHEFWDDSIERALDDLREAARGCDVAFLENDRVTIDGVEFLGCTLWSEYRVFEVPGRAHQLSAAQAMQANLPLVRDFGRIRAAAPGNAERLLTPDDCAALSARSRRWLGAALAAPRTGPRVVVTHYLPSWRSVSKAFAHSVTNAAFVNDADELIAQADVWVHGHTHSSHHYRLGGCRVVCNPRGYPRPRQAPTGFENPEFDPALTVQATAQAAVNGAPGAARPSDPPSRDLGHGTPGAPAAQ